jgi:exodeoxyribonuclease V alpha subunit
VLRNDYQLQLFNGDVGIIMRKGDHFVACFEDEAGGIRHFAPSRLPEHETVFAMTVHKSQGSEFRKILHILPNRDNPILTRELIYTAVTRAKEEVMLWADEEILRMAVSRAIRRDSGLRDFFHGPA